MNHIMILRVALPNPSPSKILLVVLIKQWVSHLWEQTLSVPGQVPHGQTGDSSIMELESGLRCVVHQADRQYLMQQAGGWGPQLRTRPQQTDSSVEEEDCHIMRLFEIMSSQTIRSVNNTKKWLRTWLRWRSSPGAGSCSWIKNTQKKNLWEKNDQTVRYHDKKKQKTYTQPL